MDESFRSVYLSDLREPVCRKIQGFIPGDPDKTAFRLLERKLQSVLRFQHRLYGLGLGTEVALIDRMIRISLYAGDAAVL
jgi:hypothetical protein